VEGEELEHWVPGTWMQNCSGAKRGLPEREGAEPGRK